MDATAVHRGLPTVAQMAVLAPVAAGASAARGVVRWDAILDLRRGVVRDCQLAPTALARDFPWAMAEPPRLPSLAQRYARKPRQAQQPQDDWQKAVYWKMLLAAWVQTTAPLRVLLALPPAPDDELESPQARSLRVQQASQPEAPLQAQESVACAPLEQGPLVQLARSALPRAQREPQVRSVSPRLARRSLAEAPQVRQISSAQP